MGKKIAKISVAFLGILLGIGICATISGILSRFNIGPLEQIFSPWTAILIYSGSGLICGAICFIFSNSIINNSLKLFRWCVNAISRQSLPKIIMSVVGLIIGLIIAILISTLIGTLGGRWISLLIKIFIYIALGYIGAAIGGKFSNEINFSGILKKRRRKKKKSALDENIEENDDTEDIDEDIESDFVYEKKSDISNFAKPKIIDTSAIIDGRFADICKTGIVEGEIVIPVFVLDELQHLADSADDMKRTKGRLGLDCVERLKKECKGSITISDSDYENIKEVDRKLIMLAMDLNGMIVTNDYNLNKVASVQNVFVFNINELANAVKTVLVPGEQLFLPIMKEGKEPGQGIAYLDDGTMVVVEGGSDMVGETIQMTVTSVLQTSAGRMIFATKNKK